MKNDNVSFVKAWQLSGSVNEVASRLGVSKSYAMIKAVRLRKLGVQLKRYPAGKGRPKIDVAALNAVIAGL